MRALALFAAIGLAACAVVNDDAASSAAADSTASVQPNDVSILYPLANATLGPDSAGNGGALLPADIYARGVGTVGPGGTPIVDRSKLRLVALRFDPCFASLTPIAETTDCQNQVRLVFQPLSAVGAEDSAVHAFYSLSREELIATVREVIAIRGDAQLGQLAVHPLLKQASLATAMNAIVLRHAGAANLTRFTTFSSSGLGTAWNFRGFDVANGQPTPMVIPTLPPNTTTVAFFRGFVKNALDGNFEPPTSSPDNEQLFASNADAKRASVAQRQAAFQALEDIEDPTKNSPNTIDCASCHAAQPLRTIVASQFGLAKAAPNLDDVDVHMFSYKGTTPSIHQRTISETTAIAAFLSTQVTP